MYLYISEIFSTDMYALYNIQCLNAFIRPYIYVYIAVFILVNNKKLARENCKDTYSYSDKNYCFQNSKSSDLS